MSVSKSETDIPAAFAVATDVPSTGRQTSFGNMYIVLERHGLHVSYAEFTQAVIEANKARGIGIGSMDMGSPVEYFGNKIAPNYTALYLPSQIGNNKITAQMLQVPELSQYRITPETPALQNAAADRSDQKFDELLNQLAVKAPSPPSTNSDAFDKMVADIADSPPSKSGGILASISTAVAAILNSVAPTAQAEPVGAEELMEAAGKELAQNPAASAAAPSAKLPLAFAPKKEPLDIEAAKRAIAAMPPTEFAQTPAAKPGELGPITICAADTPKVVVPSADKKEIPVALVSPEEKIVAAPKADPDLEALIKETSKPHPMIAKSEYPTAEAKILQKALVKLGYLKEKKANGESSADGYFGGVTEKALIAFQKDIHKEDHNFKVDALAGKKTWDALSKKLEEKRPASTVHAEIGQLDAPNFAAAVPPGEPSQAIG